MDQLIIAQLLQVQFLSIVGKAHFEGLLHLLRYIRDNKNLGLKYYSKIEDVPLYDLLGKYIIKSENQLMVLSDSICQDCTYTGRSTVAYIVFDQGGSIDNCTIVTGPVSQYSG